MREAKHEKEDKQEVDEILITTSCWSLTHKLSILQCTA